MVSGFANNAVRFAPYFVFSKKNGKFAQFKQNKHNPYTLSMKEEGKIYYEAPSTRVFEVKTEGVICASGDIPATLDGIWDEETI